jgi:uncharacterized protein YkwD
MRRWRVNSVLTMLVIGCAVALASCVGGSPGGDPFSDVLGDDANDPGVGDSGYCEPIGTPDTEAQQQMLNALNNYRLANGLGLVMYSDALEQAAQSHAQDMYVRNFFSHTNPDGEEPLDRVIAAGFCNPSLAGENIAFGQNSVSEVQSGWEDSPSHNANMLHGQVTFVGMGHYTSPLGVQYWVQVFGATFN